MFASGRRLGAGLTVGPHRVFPQFVRMLTSGEQPGHRRDADLAQRRRATSRWQRIRAGVERAVGLVHADHPGGIAAEPHRSSTLFDARSGDMVVRGLGETRVWAHGSEVRAWASHRGLTILRYLVLHRDRAVPKETLMELLWPHSSPSAARNNLNVAIYGLRRSLEVGGSGSYVVHRDGAYAIADGLTVRTDYEAFESAIAEGDRLWAGGDAAAARRAYEAVIDLYGGPLFADETSGDWYLLDQRALEDRYIASLERIGVHAVTTGDPARCVEVCHRILRVDPCRETTHRLLMEVYASGGQNQLVARQYADCVAALEKSLDVKPHPDTTLLYRRLSGRRI